MRCPSHPVIYPGFENIFSAFRVRYTGTPLGSNFMSEMDPPTKPESFDNRSFMARFLAGEYGLAITYWALYFVGCGIFFVLGGRAVDNEQWISYLIIAAAMLAYTVILIIGIRAAYKGPQLWKVMSRTSSVFMIINILVGITTLGFIY